MRCIPWVLVGLAAACGGSSNSTPDSPVSADGPVAVDAPPPDAATVTTARGKYLVDSVLACGDCHTPRDMNGPIAAKYLSGVECFIDVVPPADNGQGCLHSRNLTNDNSGLKGFSDAEVKNMFQHGMVPGGTILNNVMPYWTYAFLTDDDASSIVAYLRTVPAVDHTVPANEAPWTSPAAAPVLTDAEVPMATAGPQAGKSNGRYLAAVVCLECHSPDLPLGSARPVDVTKAFSGGRAFPTASLGIPSPPFPATIFSLNITPDATGIMGWTVDDVKKVLSMGVDNQGNPLCPPMPFGPMGAFAGLTASDATDLANYVLNLAPISNPGLQKCVAPSQ